MFIKSSMSRNTTLARLFSPNTRSWLRSVENNLLVGKVYIEEKQKAWTLFYMAHSINFCPILQSMTQRSITYSKTKIGKVTIGRACVNLFPHRDHLTFTSWPGMRNRPHCSEDSCLHVEYSSRVVFGPNPPPNTHGITPGILNEVNYPPFRGDGSGRPFLELSPVVGDSEGFPGNHHLTVYNTSMLFSIMWRRIFHMDHYLGGRILH